MGAVVLRPDQTYQRIHFPVLQVTSWEAIGAPVHPIVNAGSASAAYPAANLSILVPFSTWQTLPVNGVAWNNGSVTGGNVDVGIYDSLGVTLLTHLGSTARGAVNVLVSASLSTYILPPGNYYMAFSLDGTSNMMAWASTAGLWAAMGVLEAATNFPLATGITPVLATHAYMPTFGLLLDSTAI